MRKPTWATAPIGYTEEAEAERLSKRAWAASARRSPKAKVLHERAEATLHLLSLSIGLGAKKWEARAAAHGHEAAVLAK